MTVKSSQIFLPATVNIMAQLIASNKDEFENEISYFKEKLLNGYTYVFPKPFMRLIDLESLKFNFNDELNIALQFINSFNQLFTQVSADEPIGFFKMCRAYNLLTGCNLKMVPYLLNQSKGSAIMTGLTRQLLKCIPFYTSYQEIEFHLLYKVLKLLYALDCIIEQMLLEEEEDNLPNLFLHYVLQCIKYYRFASELHKIETELSDIFNGNSTSAKGIIFLKIGFDFRTKLFYATKFEILPGLRKILDMNSEVYQMDLLNLQTKIQTWLNRTQYYLTVKLKFNEIGLHILGKLENSNSYSQSQNIFFKDNDRKYKTFFHLPIFKFSDLEKYFINNPENVLPIQIFTLINNAFKNPEGVLTFLGILTPLMTLLAVQNAIMYETKVIQPILIFNALLEKSEIFNEKDVNYYFELYFLAERFIYNSSYKLNKEAFQQFFLFGSSHDRIHTVQLLNMFKTNYENVHKTLFGLASTKAIVAYNHILGAAFNNQIGLHKFRSIQRSYQRLQTLSSETTNASEFSMFFLRTIRDIVMKDFQNEAEMYLNYTINVLKESIPSFMFPVELQQVVENIYSKGQINEAYAAFKSQINKIKERKLLNDNKFEKERIIQSLSWFLKQFEEEINLNDIQIQQSRNIFLNFLDLEILHKQDKFVQEIKAGLLGRPLFNKFEINDQESVRWLSDNRKTIDTNAVPDE